MKTPKDVKDEIRALIDYMFSNNLPEIEFQKCPIVAVTEILKEYGYRETDNPTETNGWQVDWWMDYICEGKPDLILSGDVYYDYTCKLSINEEDTTEEREELEEDLQPKG